MVVVRPKKFRPKYNIRKSACALHLYQWPLLVQSGQQSSVPGCSWWRNIHILV